VKAEPMMSEANRSKIKELCLILRKTRAEKTTAESSREQREGC